MNDDATAVDVTRAKADFARYVRIVHNDTNLLVYRAVAMVLAGIIVFSLDDWLNGQPWVRHHVIEDYSILFLSALPALFLILFAGILRLLTRNMDYVAPGQDFLRPKRIRIDEKGVHETSQVSDRFVAWAGIVRMARHRHYLLFYIDRLTAFVIPVRDFGSPETAAAFYARAETLWKAAGGTPATLP